MEIIRVEKNRDYTVINNTASKQHRFFNVANISSEDIAKVSALKNKSGVYIISAGKTTYYIGASTNLKSRMGTSLSDRRYGIPAGNLTISWIFTDTRTDAYLLEVYLIMKLRPKLNAFEYSSDGNSFKIEPPEKYNTISDSIEVELDSFTLPYQNQ